MIDLLLPRTFGEIDTIQKKISRLEILMNNKEKSRAILSRALEPVRDRISSSAPVGKTGHLSDGFYVLDSPRYAQDSNYRTEIVGMGGQAYIYAASNAFYWKFIDKGWDHYLAKRHISGTKFVQRSIDATKQQAYKTVIAEFEREIKNIQK